MPKNTAEVEIQDRVSVFVDELSELIRKAALEAVEEALGGSGAMATPGRRKSGAPTRRKTTARKSPAKKGKRIRRSPEDLEARAEAILAYVKAHPGERLEEISAGMRTGSKELKRPIQILLGARKLKKTGEKRGTQYFTGAAKGAKKGAKKAGKKVSRKKTGKKVAKKARRKTGRKVARKTRTTVTVAAG